MTFFDAYTGLVIKDWYVYIRGLHVTRHLHIIKSNPRLKELTNKNRYHANH